MMIDPDTARNLELVGNMTHKKSTHSLFGTLGHTWTAMANRLLRVNILSPITGVYGLTLLCGLLILLYCLQFKVPLMLGSMLSKVGAQT
jgi:hypothetical protein